MFLFFVSGDVAQIENEAIAICSGRQLVILRNYKHTQQNVLFAINILTVTKSALNLLNFFCRESERIISNSTRMIAFWRHFV